MKNHYLAGILAIAGFFLSGNAQQTVIWGPETTVADGSVYGNVRPRLTLTSGNEPVVIIGRSPGELYVAKWNGNAFGTPVLITPEGLNSYLAYWTGPDIAAYGDTVIAVFKALPFDTGKIYAVRSVDGGATFSDTIRVENHATGRVFLPSLDLDVYGNPSVMYMAFDGSADNPRYVVTRSTDSGLTFTPGQEIASSGMAEACDCCPGELVINGNRQVALYRNNVQNIRDIYGSLSMDGGATFEAAQNLEYLGWNINQCPSTGPHGILIGDTLYSVAASQASGAYRVSVAVSSVANNLEYAYRQQLLPPLNSGGKQNYPRISGQNDTIVVVWEERESNNPEVYCSVTTNGNVSGLAAAKSRVNTVTSGVQTNPDVVYRDGFVHVVFSDAVSGDVIYRRGTISEVAGVPEITTEALQVFPNPSANGQFCLKSWNQSMHLLRAVDIYGNIITATVVDDEDGYSIRLEPEAANGVYFISIANESGYDVLLRVVKSGL